MNEIFHADWTKGGSWISRIAVVLAIVGTAHLVKTVTTQPKSQPGFHHLGSLPKGNEYLEYFIEDNPTKLSSTFIKAEVYARKSDDTDIDILRGTATADCGRTDQLMYVSQLSDKSVLTFNSSTSVAHNIWEHLCSRIKQL